MTTANRLTKGLYEQGTRDFADKLFGLKRFRSDELCHNAGWFNANGERIGYGDLSKEDIKRIADGLEEGELFVVLPEQYIVWNKSERHPDPMSLDLEYIRDHVQMIITPKRVLWVAHGTVLARFLHDGELTMEVITSYEADKVITRYAGVAS